MEGPMRAFALLVALVAGTAPLTLTAADDGRLVTVRPGRAIVLRLASTPGTGYAWRFAARPDARVVRLVSMHLEEPRSGVVGAPATQVWRFAAVARGTTRLGLVYVRPWLPRAPAKTFALRFRVR
jgi:inhibitor of cysteine peptidase